MDKTLELEEENAKLKRLLAGHIKISNEKKDTVIQELIAVIKQIEGNWITADHYWGSETNDKAYRAIIDANKIIK